MPAIKLDSKTVIDLIGYVERRTTKTAAFVIEKVFTPVPILTSTGKYSMLFVI